MHVNSQYRAVRCADAHRCFFPLRSGSGTGWALGEEGIRAFTQPKSLQLHSWAPRA